MNASNGSTGGGTGPLPKAAAANAERPFDPERLSVALIAAASAAMLVVSWQKWADPLIDFGRDLYIAWRLSAGDILYRDVSHYYAPLSSWLNLAWFEVFGISYRSLVAGNAIVLASTVAATYWLLRRIASLLASTAALLVMILVFALGQYIPVGNYNFLSPYSHELTHGLLLALLSGVALALYLENPRRPWLVALGFLIGLVFLTKYEVFIAVLGGAAVALVAAHRDRTRERRAGGLDILTLIAVMGLPAFVCWSVLVMIEGLTPDMAMRAVLGPYAFMFNGSVASSRFLWGLAGLATPGLALFGIVGWTFYYCVATAPAAFLGRSEPRLNDRIYGIAALGLPVVALSLFGPLLSWRQLLLPLPFCLLSLLILQFSRLRGERSDASKQHLTLFLISFALLLLLRIPLNAGVSHYGFALALPGTLLLIVFALDQAPAWFNARGLNGGLFRKAVFTILTLFVGSALYVSGTFLTARIFTLGEAADTLRVDARGAVVAKAVQVVLEKVGPEQTLVVLPEGAMVNYLARRRSSVSHVVFHPTALSMYGEDTLLRELATHPPDYVLAFSREIRDLREFGCVAFGENCAQAIGAWMKGNYRAQVIGVSGKKRLFTLLARTDASSPGHGPEVIEISSPQ